MPWALVLALARAGRSMPARIAMMAMTTRSSIKVNAALRGTSGAKRPSLDGLVVIRDGFENLSSVHIAGTGSCQGNYAPAPQSVPRQQAGPVPSPSVHDVRRSGGAAAVTLLCPADCGGALSSRRPGPPNPLAIGPGMVNPGMLPNPSRTWDSIMNPGSGLLLRVGPRPPWPLG